MDTWVLSIPGIRNIKVRCTFGGGEKTVCFVFILLDIFLVCGKFG